MEQKKKPLSGSQKDKKQLTIEVQRQLMIKHTFEIFNKSVPICHKYSSSQYSNR